MPLQALGGSSLASGVKGDHPVLFCKLRNVVVIVVGRAAVSGNQHDRIALFGGMILKVQNRVITGTEKIILACHDYPPEIKNEAAIVF